jgi:hypothetical protein
MGENIAARDKMQTIAGSAASIRTVVSDEARIVTLLRIVGAALPVKASAEFQYTNVPASSQQKPLNDLLPMQQQAKSGTSVAQKSRDLVHEVREEGMGILADEPYSNCDGRKKPCWLHIDDKLGKSCVFDSFIQRSDPKAFSIRKIENL